MALTGNRRPARGSPQQRFAIRGRLDRFAAAAVVDFTSWVVSRQRGEDRSSVGGQEEEFARRLWPVSA